MESNPSLPEEPQEEATDTKVGFIQVSCYSDAGKQRERNEDACALPPTGANRTQYGTLLVLADGIGGLPGGADASRAAVSNLQALYYAETGSSHPADRLREAVGAVNALISYKQRQLEYKKGYLTTLVAAATLSDQIWIANVGDSRAYLIQGRKKQIQKLTEDHSGHVRNVKSGLTNESDVYSQRAGVITRAIGLSEDCQVDTYHYAWEPGDRLLLCSDGLNSLTAEEIIAITLQTSADTAAKELVSRAVELDGSDNCTAVVAAWVPTEEFQPQLDEESGITLLKNPKPLTENEGNPEAVDTIINPPVTIRTRRRSIWQDLLGPILVGILLGLSLAVLTAMILLQMELITIKF